MWFSNANMILAMQGFAWANATTLFGDRFSFALALFFCLFLHIASSFLPARFVSPSFQVAQELMPSPPISWGKLGGARMGSVGAGCFWDVFGFLGISLS